MIMDRITITADATADDLAAIALCIHQLFSGLPVTARSRNKTGVQVEAGKVKSKAYTGSLLEQALAEGRVIRGRPESGAYKGTPVVIAPVLVDGKAIAAFGVVDTLGSLDIKALMDQYSHIEKQVSGHK
jgi:hypothetical protein